MPWQQLIARERIDLHLTLRSTLACNNDTKTPQQCYSQKCYVQLLTCFTMFFHFFSFLVIFLQNFYFFCRNMQFWDFLRFFEIFFQPTSFLIINPSSPNLQLCFSWDFLRFFEMFLNIFLQLLAIIVFVLRFLFYAFYLWGYNWQVDAYLTTISVLDVNYCACSTLLIFEVSLPSSCLYSGCLAQDYFIWTYLTHLTDCNELHEWLNCNVLHYMSEM